MPIEFETTVEIAAPPDRIWSVLTDVEHWPEWTASITSVDRRDGGPFGIAARYLITQPKLRPAMWRVTFCRDGEGFVWESKSLGAYTVAEHWIKPKQTTPPTSSVTLKVQQTGAMITLLRPWIEKITRRYVEMEAQGLSRHCEAGLED
jgi:uncharacterized membrane protein